MKNFRTLEQAKKDIQVIQEYVNLIENYQPTDFIQHGVASGKCGFTTLRKFPY